MSILFLNSLPMYDWPEVRPFTDEFWSGLARHLGTEAGKLVRGGDFTASWREPNLLFSQTCGYPFTHDFKGILTYVATPSYDADGCGSGTYRSFIFAREKKDARDIPGLKPAINSWDSMSGMLALRLVGGNLSEAVVTGSHLASLAAVQSGAAEVCATDSVCVAMARRYKPEVLEGLVEIVRSPEVPALPYVTRAGDVGKLRTALSAAFADPEMKNAREKLLLKDVVVLPEGAYDVILQKEAAL